jgi:phosphohistidine phosphatase
MNVYLVQHGEAQPKSADPARPLTERGGQDAQRVAAFAARLGVEVGQIRHSGKTRAEQTAAVFGQALSPPGGVAAVPGLAPLDDVRPVADALAGESQPMMLVGHLPFMARLAGLLVTGDPDRPVVQFRKAGVVCLAREDDRWVVAWVLTPEMAGVGGEG